MATLQMSSIDLVLETASVEPFFYFLLVLLRNMLKKLHLFCRLLLVWKRFLIEILFEIFKM